MTNATAMLNQMICGYDKLAGAHEYIWGFTQNGVVYMAITDASALPYVCKLDKASRGAGYALRFKPTIAQKLFLMTSASVLCSEKFSMKQLPIASIIRARFLKKWLLKNSGRFGQKTAFLLLNAEISISMVLNIR